MSKAFEAAFNLLADNLIGHGSCRKVFTSPILPDAVIKVEERAHSFQNIMEWQTWKEVESTEMAKNFAPCLYLSPCGIVLIQAKTTQAALSQYPEMMPAYLCDFKRCNYGMYEGRLVCHDYGLNLAMQHGIFTKKKLKANWNDCL